MAVFAYRAVDGQGAAQRGTLEAETVVAARKSLRDQDLLPIQVDPVRTVKPGRLPPKTLALVTRQLATLIGGDVRIEEALSTVAQEATPKAAAVLAALRSAVLDGRSFGQALGDHPAIFGEFYQASVRAGESAGQLPSVMEHLAVFVETRAKNAQTVQLALLYPALLALVSLGVIVALLTFVVPDIVRVFSNRGAELPGLTRALIATSEAVQRYGLWAVAGTTVVAMGMGAALRNPATRLRWHRAMLRVPGLRGLVLKSNTSQFAGTLATLTISHVPLTDALAAAADTVPNLAIRAEVRQATVRVREGVALSTALRDTGVFPPLLLAMIVSGEANGRLGASLTRAAEDQARDLEAVVAATVALVEPGVLLLMGGVVMLLVMAILLPIVNLNSLAG